MMKSASETLVASPLAFQSIKTDSLHAVLVPTKGFPIVEAEIGAVREFLRLLREALSSEWKLSGELFLQHDQMHKADAAGRFADSAKQWRPRLGLGLWPGRNLPALWTKEEFMALEPGQKMRKVSYKLFRAERTPKVQDSMWEVMLGLGTLLEIWLPSDDLGFFKRTREFIVPQIQERAFRNYLFYAPLLAAKDLGSVGIDQWLCGASAYIRESVEDQGILIATNFPLDPLLERLVARMNRHERPTWQTAS
jgi:hypothetical protein